MNEMVKTVRDAFQRFFNTESEAVYFAPGRVNLIGEHTDYNGGFVLPTAIDYGTYLAIKPRRDATIRVVAGNFDDAVSDWSLAAPVERTEHHSWSNYLRGVCAHFVRENLSVTGMDIYALGNVPRGAGLSSSASFSVAFATVCNELNHLGLSEREVARICQYAESEFAGCNCGIMDQLASAAGEAGSALLLDCRDLHYRPVRVPDALSLMIIDSKVERQLVGSEYNDRRADCERAARTMGLDSLRDADLAMLEKYRPQLDDHAFRRARHVLTENDRTVEAATALAAGDLPRLHELMAGSHISMREDFEITVPEIDAIAEAVEQQLDEDGGVRMTGGGFGGCVIALVPEPRVEAIAARVKKDYARRFDKQAEVHICHASAGARRL